VQDGRAVTKVRVLLRLLELRDAGLERARVRARSRKDEARLSSNVLRQRARDMPFRCAALVRERHALDVCRAGIDGVVDGEELGRARSEDSSACARRRVASWDGEPEHRRGGGAIVRSDDGALFEGPFVARGAGLDEAGAHQELL
jgi:hypothetical protein